ncbi:PCI domain-containing protein [Irpex rosettiformis]|uniref:PCI domain-containing protein n=1 Tax=Irpex rosettiformis TaxID=378272 RepID=A0ACB8U7U1_9APHY|nr:PCI domain-containing protein [Irpex rosettiformis]
MADVEMKPIDESKKEEKTEEKTDSKEEPKKQPPSVPEEIKTNVALIERAVSTFEPRFTLRVLRTLAALRKRLNDKVLAEAVELVYPPNSQTKSILLSWIPKFEQTMDVDASTTSPAPTPRPKSDPVPEVEIYLRLLVLHHLLTNSSTLPQALKLAGETIEKMQNLNRRTMDPIAAKIWFAVDRTYELAGNLADARPLLLAAQRTASLRQDDETQASLINRLLRNYLFYNLYDQADKLVSKTSFPISAANAQHARYHYYLGRIKAVQLNYSAAHTNLQQAIRRSPPATTAPGFYQAVHKLSVVVELLMGDIPERSLFRHPVLEKALTAYFEIVQAVRGGSLSQFQATLSKHAAQFEADRTYSLIVRLRQNVIKTGIRRLSLSYSRISLRDICVKLHLDSEEDAEYIVGKAIRDGVIEGRILHEQGWLECGAQKSGYGFEVSDVFMRRISYCLELHNQSVKAMRYPLNAHRKELDAAEAARQREAEYLRQVGEDGGGFDDEPGIGEGY